MSAAGARRSEGHHRGVLLPLVRLSRGLDPFAEGADWEAMLPWARRERLLALAWHRSGETIRRSAPARVVSQWRAEVLRDLDRSEAQHRSLGDVLAALREIRIEPVVLKGGPLAQRLYGDRNARPSLDVDLYVPEGDRGAARRTMHALGWSLLGGSAPWEESFHRIVEGHQLLLELHSRLLDAPELWYLHMPAPAHAPVEVDGLRMEAQDGPLLPACMAAHLAKHPGAPLLWVNDLAALWSQLGESDRAAASAAASACGLERHLRWGVQRARWLEEAVNGDTRGLERLGYQDEGGRREAHTLLRLAWLAATPGDAAGVLGGRLWPPHLRGDGRGFVRQAVDRVAGRLMRALRPSRWATEGRALPGEGLRGDGLVGAAPDAPAGRALDVGRGEFGLLLSDMLRAGGGTWIRARGDSMEPTIPNATLVHLVAAPGRSLRPGDVVLARMPNGSYALHRVQWEEGGRVGTKGDAIPCPDLPVDRASVIAVADLLQVGGQIRAVPPAPTVVARYLSAFVRRARRRWGRRSGQAPSAANAGQR